MARMAIPLTRTASTTLSVGTAVADATRPRRFRLYDFTCGSPATAGDGNFLWSLARCTAAGTSTGVTPRMIDPADSATELDAGENHTIAATITANSSFLTIALNQRATFRWVAASVDSEILFPATASNGVAVDTPTAGSLVTVAATLFVNEH